MGSPGCLWLGRLWILSPVDMSGAQLSFILFVVRDKLYFGFRPGSHQGGSSQQSARQTLFGKDSLPNGFKLYIQICRETDLINHRHYKNTQKAKKNINIVSHLHQWDLYDPVVHEKAMGR